MKIFELIANDADEGATGQTESDGGGKSRPVEIGQCGIWQPNFDSIINAAGGRVAGGG